MKLLRPVSDRVRPEIQALRAIAVLMVTVFHFFPTVVPGGYAGVDVFFVISGYLITLHLLRQLADGRILLLEFWARRARRLLPAALLVIALTSVGVLAFVPHSRWHDSTQQAVAAAFYVLNWLLTKNAVNYLAATNDPTAFQHYWSLSVEEQFYIAWPILLILAAVLTRKARNRTRFVSASALVLVTLSSFVICIWLTDADAAAAYFTTFTRVWEFGIGGLLAFVPSLRYTRLRTAAAWLGIAAIVSTAFGYSSTTQFPGVAALLPTLGAAAVIYGTAVGGRSSIETLSRFRPIQFIGDVSYSMYLWHWPIVVILPYVVGGKLPWWLALVGFAVSIALASASKHWVEDPFRQRSWFSRGRPRRSLLGTLTAMGLVAILPTVMYVTNSHEARDSAEQFRTAFSSGTACLGAAALSAAPCGGGLPPDALYPNPSNLLNDTGDAYACYQNQPVGAPTGRLKVCSAGSNAPDATRVAISGDSHAAMILYALEPQFKRLNWHVDTYIGNGLAGSNWENVDPGDDRFSTERWLQRRLVSGRYSIILTTGERARPAGLSVADVAAQRAAVWTEALDRGIAVVAIADDPLISTGQWAKCTAYRDISVRQSAACTPTVAEALTAVPDPLLVAAAREPRATLIDLRDLYCTERTCPLVIGHVIVYRDGHHLTASYARTVGPILAQRIQTALTSTE